MSSSMREKVTKVSVTALSISSTHMNITSGLRRTSSPTAPIEKMIEPEHQVPGRRDLGDGEHHARLRGSARPRRLGSSRLGSASAALGLVGATSGSSISSARLHLARQHHGADDRDHEEHAGDLEGEQVGGEERLAELVDVGARRVEEVGCRRPRPARRWLAVGGPEGEERQGEHGQADDHRRRSAGRRRAARSTGPRRGRRRAASARTGTARRWRRRRRSPARRRGSAPPGR